MLDHGLFLEFVPGGRTWRPRSRAGIGSADAEVGCDYALAVTSNAGLWSMLVGDRVRLVSLDPPRIVLAGTARAGAAGRRWGVLTVGALDRAVAGAAAEAGRPVCEYAAHGFRTAGWAARRAGRGRGGAARRCRIRAGARGGARGGAPGLRGGAGSGARQAARARAGRSRRAVSMRGCGSANAGAARTRCRGSCRTLPSWPICWV